MNQTFSKQKLVSKKPITKTVTQTETSHLFAMTDVKHIKQNKQHALNKTFIPFLVVMVLVIVSISVVSGQTCVNNQYYDSVAEECKACSVCGGAQGEVEACTGTSDAVCETYFTFTTCGQTGATAPTEANCESSYGTGSVTGNSGFDVTNGVQKWTVPRSGLYQFDLYGGGGGGTYFQSHNGWGAKMYVRTLLHTGDVLHMIIGQKGTPDFYVGGGGGATWLSTSPYDSASTTNYVVAGGGGGGAISIIGGDSTTESASGTSCGHGSEGADTYLSGGGGGLCGSSSNGQTGRSLISGGAAGDADGDCPDARGGFGGGGSPQCNYEGSGYYTGGGGGGFVGGDGGSVSSSGSDRDPGSGGTSQANGFWANVGHIGNANGGNGKIEVTDFGVTGCNSIQYYDFVAEECKACSVCGGAQGEVEACTETSNTVCTTSFTFTTCGQYVATMPTEANCESSYGTGSVTGNAGFDVTNGVQKWTVPRSGLYQFDLYGGGGGGTNNQGHSGWGAKMSVRASLHTGDVLHMIIGQKGGSDYIVGGGGGATWLSTSPYDSASTTNYVVAGGGGGNSFTSIGGDSTTESASGASCGHGSGGTYTYLSGGGGGLCGSSSNGQTGKSLISGGAAGDADGDCTDARGGFGGGGSAGCGPSGNSYSAGGGGGGFVGGDGGVLVDSYHVPGSGGTSQANGFWVNVGHTGNANGGNGKIEVTHLGCMVCNSKEYEAVACTSNCLSVVS